MEPEKEILYFDSDSNVLSVRPLKCRFYIQFWQKTQHEILTSISAGTAPD